MNSRLRDELCYTPVVELRRLLHTNELSAEELTAALLERLEEVNPQINAIVATRADGAMREARAADSKPASERGPLHGIPFTAKDLNETLELPTTLGSRAFAGHSFGFEALVVTRMKQAGGILLGKTNTPEFGLRATTENRLFGTSRNPWNLAYNPGGSSGGAAAASAAGISPLAIGSDGGGSIRGPSSCCGLAGLKPTRGRVPGAPAAYESWAGLATNGPITRSVRDTALMLDVLAGPVLGEPYGLPAAPAGTFLSACERTPPRLRLAFTVAPAHGSLLPEVRDAVLQAVGTFRSMGHDVVEAGPDLGELFAHFMVILMAHTAALAPLVEEPKFGELEPTTLALMLEGEKLTAADYCLAVDEARRRAAEIMRFWEEYDFLLTPTGTHLPFPNGWSVDELHARWRAILDFDAFMYQFNVTGQPAISIPCGWSQEEHLPIGLQIVGKYGADADVLALAARYEEARPWIGRRPEMSAAEASTMPPP